jgi:hypothetical protein
MTMTTRLRQFALCAVLLCSACAAPWWQQPPQEEGKVFAIGSVIKGKNLSASRTFAIADGQAKLAMYLGSQVQALTEVYNGTGGDGVVPEGAPEFFNNESIIRSLTNTRLMGAKTLRYGSDEKYYYALLVLDMEAFTKLWKQTLQAEAAKRKYMESQALREAYSNKLDRALDTYRGQPDYRDGASIDRNSRSVRNPRGRRVR